MSGQHYFTSDEWYRHVVRFCYARRHADEGYRQGVRWAINRLKRRSDYNTGGLQ